MIMTKVPVGNLMDGSIWIGAGEHVSSLGTSSDKLWYSINSHGGRFRFLALERNHNLCSYARMSITHQVPYTMPSPTTPRI